MMKKDTIYGRFSQWASRQPDAVAVAEDSRSVTYQSAWHDGRRYHGEILRETICRDRRGDESWHRDGSGDARSAEKRSRICAGRVDIAAEGHRL